MIFEILTDSAHVKDLIQRSAVNIEAQELISKFAELQRTRMPFFLTLYEFDTILKWKLRRQYERQRELRKKNTDHNIIAITKAVFDIKHDNDEIATELKIKMLCTISGVEVPVASAILTICGPNYYSVIDFRNWRQIFPESKSKTSYKVSEYLTYLKIIREIAEKLNLTPQEIDMAIWQLDIDKNSLEGINE
jgi:thermostable 8-oxoguanine DNA glycosylase